MEIRCSTGARRLAAVFAATVTLAAASLSIQMPANAAAKPTPAASRGATTVNGLPIESPAWRVPTHALPFTEGPVTSKSSHARIQALQQRLRWSGLDWLWASGNLDLGTRLAVRVFQGKFFLPSTGRPDATTVAKLISIAGDGKLDKRCLSSGIVLCVDKTQKVTRFVRNGMTIRTLNTNFGPEKGHPKFGLYSATREGEFKIFAKSEVTMSSLYNVPMPYWMAFDRGIGFHYSEYFHKTGYFDTSMGCTTLEDLGGAKWLFENTPMGTTVVVYKSGALIHPNG